MLMQEGAVVVGTVSPLELELVRSADTEESVVETSTNSRKLTSLGGAFR